MFHPRDKRIIKSHVTYKVGLDFYHITNAINVVPLQSHTQSLINIPSLILISTAEGIVTYWWEVVVVGAATLSQ